MYRATMHDVIFISSNKVVLTLFHLLSNMFCKSKSLIHLKNTIKIQTGDDMFGWLCVALPSCSWHLDLQKAVIPVLCEYHWLAKHLKGCIQPASISEWADVVLVESMKVIWLLINNTIKTETPIIGPIIRVYPYLKAYVKRCVKMSQRKWQVRQESKWINDRNTKGI